ncbi:MAG TPA: hypothetical protein VGI03_07560 [Verrucomicrobiae bacterium]|jgi:hypothetical protein
MIADVSVVTVFLQFLMIAVFVVVALLIAGNQKRDRRQRSDLLCDLGKSLGFDQFNPGRDEGFMVGWGFLGALSRGENRYACNILRGNYHGQALFAFDFHYRADAGENKGDNYGTLLMLIEKEVFPQLIIQSGNLQERIAAALGIGNEVKFESAEFSRVFSVRSQDKRFAYDVCNPQMMDYLMGNRDLQIEINGPVISMAFEPQLPVEQIELNLQRLAQIRSLMPDYLFTQNA